MTDLTVGIFSPMFSEVNGTAKASRTLAFSLAKAGAEVHVYAPKADRFNSPKLPNLYIHPIRAIRLSADPEVYMAFPLEKFFFYKKCSHLDITHSTSCETMGLYGMNMAKLNDRPKVVTHHSPFEYYVEEYLGPIFGRFIRQWVRYYEKFIYGQYDLISTPTLSKKRLLLEWGYKKKPILAISNGLESKYFKIADGSVVREKYKLGDKKLLVYASRMSPEKHIKVIARVFPRIARRFPDAHLVFVGTGPELEPTKKIVKDLHIEDKVTFTGFVPFRELLQWYRAADVTCIWSYVEAQGLVILEAMAQETPTVGTDANGIKDTIINGKTGFLAKNLSDFVDKVVYLFENDEIREQFGKNARAHVENYHRIDNIAKTWLKVYEKLISYYPKYKGTWDHKELHKKIFEHFAERTQGIDY